MGVDDDTDIQRDQREMFESTKVVVNAFQRL